ncbi:Transposase and inactivated derivatives [Thermoactinomyces sp. DSM 45891]|nr:Transposase and inactivated derivatives [Thermoactinomyces sp. DSM 45891]
MAKYSVETKLEAVRAYLDGVESYRDIAEKYQVSITPLQEWVAKYQEHGINAFQKGYTNYSAEFKMDVLNFMSDTGASFTKTAAVFNIPTPSTIYQWQNLFREQGLDALQPKKKGRSSLEKKPQKKLELSTEEVLRAENKRLQMENAYLKKLNALIHEREKSANKTKPK